MSASIDELQLDVDQLYDWVAERACQACHGRAAAGREST
jgi:hypothetical protein